MRKILIIILLALIANLLLSCYVACNNVVVDNDNNGDSVATIIKVDTIVKKDTVEVVKPKLSIKTVIKTDTLITLQSDTVEMDLEIKEYADTIDSVSYFAKVSGYNPSLDSIAFVVPQKTIYVDRIQYINRKKTFKDRFHLSPSLGVGYGLINKKVDIYAGVSINFEL